MKRFLRKMFPLLIAAAILGSIGWYLFEYDPGFTRDFLLHQARKLEDNGNHTAAVWLYNLAYEQFDGSADVAIELAEQFKGIGNYSKAEFTLRKALEEHATEELYIALSKTYVEQGKLRDAVLMLEHADASMQQKLASLRPEAPTASVEPGTYREYLHVEISCTSGKLYTTLDGDYPSTQDLYTGPIVLQEGQTNIWAVSVGENGLVSPLSVFSYAVGNVVEEVHFQDPGFDAVVRSLLNFDADHAIYSNTLWDVTELVLDASVGSTSDLKWFPNLQTLVMDHAGIDTLDALRQMDKLQNLSITDTILNSTMMDCIASVTTLRSLSLSNCAISSVESLQDLTELVTLDLSENAIRNIDGLSGMTKLTHLDLHSNALVHLDGMQTLTALQYLDVSYNSLVSTQSIEHLSQLTYLNLTSNALRSLEGVEQLLELTHFIAQHNELLDVDVLAPCQKLVYLDVSYNTLLHVDVVASLASLEELYFAYNDVTQLPKFRTDCALRIINGEYNQLSSLNNLAGLINLTNIYMDYNVELSNIDALIACPELEEVFVYGSKVRSVSKLTEVGIYVVYTPA